MKSRLPLFSTLLIFMFIAEGALAASANWDENFTLQVAAFPEAEDAKGEAFISQLAEAGEQPIWGTIEIPGRGNWMRIFIGSFKSAAEAKQYGEKLLERRLIKQFVIKKLSDIKDLTRPRSVIRKAPAPVPLQMKSSPMQARPPSLDRPPEAPDPSGPMPSAPTPSIPRPVSNPSSPKQSKQTRQKQDAAAPAVTVSSTPPCFPLSLSISDFKMQSVALAPVINTDLLPHADAAQVAVKVITHYSHTSYAATGGLWLSGDFREGLSRLKWILGKDADLLTVDKQYRVSLDWQLLEKAAHLEEVSPVVAPLVLLDYISANEGLLLMVQLTQGKFRYLFHLSATAPTLGSEIAVSGSLNLDNNYDSRINAYRRGGKKLDIERPPQGFDCLVALNPAARWFNLYTKELVQVGNIAFHELTEAYAKVEFGFEYLPQGSIPGAHNMAISREMILKAQRANVVLTAGSNRVLKSEEELQRIYAEIAAGQQP
jgi:hypothetical protein